jgi:hypothetical protein
MSTAKWATPSAQGSNIASTTLDSLANGSTSTVVTHDNSSNLDLYASVLVNLGSFTSTTGATITLRVFSLQSSDAPDTTGAAVDAGDFYTKNLTVGASAKVVVFPMIRLYPESMRLCITNNSGAAFAGSSNSIKVRPYNESVV